MSSSATIKDQYAHFLVEKKITQDISHVNLSDFSDDLVDKNAEPVNKLPVRADRDHSLVDPTTLKVGIIGAGIAGLYTALLLERVGIKYEILEASDRIGGRIFTKYFTPEKKKHDYYDIGAMRFPNTPLMKRTFDLFDLLNICDGEGGLRIPYYMKGENQPTRYNDKTVILPQEEKKVAIASSDFDPFKVSIKNHGSVPDESVADPKTIMDDAYSTYRDKLKRDPPLGFRYLMRHDKFSLRDYLHFVEGYDFETIQWLETLYSATGWFDESFSENVLESLAFDFYDKDPPDLWWCIDGGTEVVVEKLRPLIKGPILMKKRVISIALDKDRPGGDSMVVQVAKEESPRYYSTVINTTTLAALQKMDLTKLQLPYATKTAIRSLRYDTSTKVGIKFKEPWWITKCGINKGGLGKTDMPLRVCVYPSYNIHDDKDKPAVLLCSYTWGQDSERIASLVNVNSPEGEEDLRDLMLYNLARLHSVSEVEFESLHKTIKDSYITHHAYDWSKDPFSSGAFALFGPSQFSRLYPYLIRPTSDSRFHIAGEAASAHHAWIVGALNSSVRAVHFFLERFRLDKKQEKLKDIFGPCYEIDYKSAHVQVAWGMLPMEKQQWATV